MKNNVMRLYFLFVFFAYSFSSFSFSLNSSDSLLISGPMVGFVTDSTALIWLEVNSGVKDISINYWKKDEPESKQTINKARDAKVDSIPEKIIITGLTTGTIYNYTVEINKAPIVYSAFPQFKTDGKSVNNFSFLIGSCLYINDRHDDNKKPYGASPKILEAMMDEKTEMMLWLGDNVYLRPNDCKSPKRIKKRYCGTRSTPELQGLIATRSNYATWDDHDYGPDNSASDFVNAEASLNIFKSYWGNKYFGNETKGIYSSFTREDCQFIFTDDRSFRSPINTDSKNFKNCINKDFFGTDQLAWIKRKLKESTSTFKFVIVGNQVLNQKAEKECFFYYKREYEDLMKFISDNKIEGVLFLTGDRHFSELIKTKSENGYTFYDFTCSSLTSEIRNVNKTSERDNGQRIPNTLVTENNFGKIEVSGDKGARKLLLSVQDKKGKVIWDFKISEEELKFN